MPEVPSHVWSIYQNYQTQNSKSPKVTSAYWAVERGLDELLNLAASGTSLTEEEVMAHAATAMATGGWGERNHTRILRRRLPDGHSRFEERVMARKTLDEQRAQVTSAEWAILTGIANGLDYHHLAVSTGTSSGALRTKVSRLRRKLTRN